MKTDRERKNAEIVVIRWSARILGVIMGGFFLLMFIGARLESNPLSEPIKPMAAIGLALLGIYAVAMFLALKWERVGFFLGVVGLGGFFVLLFMGLLSGNGGSSRALKGLPIFLAFWLPIWLYFAVLGTRKAGAGTNEGGSLNR